MEQVFWRQIDPSLVERAEKLLTRWLGAIKVSVSFPDTQVDDHSLGIFLEIHVPELESTEYVEMDWNEVSAMGLIVALNFSIFHPRGLAIARDPHNGESPYLLVADDGVWEYTPEILEEAKNQLNHVGIYIPGLNDD
ncbi:hypothetical protein NVX19_003511 [Salmonella enterica]|nr:hypothetical protein [Salmonella enterica]